MTLLNELNEGAGGPAFNSGQYQAVDDFRLRLGAWSVSFKKGTLIKVIGTRVKAYDPLSKTWVNRKPPIDGHENFSLDNWGQRDAQDIVDTFHSNTKKLSLNKLDELVKGSAQEKVMTVKQAQKLLDGMKKNAKVKITVV